jgi:phytanoyl-CoA hydroxylase
MTEPETGNCSLRKSEFDTDGFVAIRQFVTGDRLSAVQSHVQRFLRDIVPRMPPERVFFEQKDDLDTLKQIQHMATWDPWFHSLSVAGDFRELAEELLQSPVVPRNLQYFNKPAGTGLPTPPHQDAYYFMLEPSEAVTMWLSLDDVDTENGCVRYVRGSHRNGLRPHVRTQTLGFSQGIADYPSDADRLQEVPLPAQPGDLLAHHALTIHRADGNHSVHRTRKALGFIYYSERARENLAAHRAYQQQLAGEMSAAGRI